MSLQALIEKMRKYNQEYLYGEDSEDVTKLCEAAEVYRLSLQRIEAGFMILRNTPSIMKREQMQFEAFDSLAKADSICGGENG